MEAATARCSHVVCSPSIRPACHVPLTGFFTSPSGFWCRRQRTPRPLLCATYALDPFGADDPVDVIGIGSRKDSIIDFCLASPAVSASRFRFWTIYSRDQKKVQLLERCNSKDVFIRNVEFPLATHLCLPATILVASSGHDLDQIVALDLLCGIKSVGGLAIAIVLKPFSFEGQRRQKELSSGIFDRFGNTIGHGDAWTYQDHFTPLVFAFSCILGMKMNWPMSFKSLLSIYIDASKADNEESVT